MADSLKNAANSASGAVSSAGNTAASGAKSTAASAQKTAGDAGNSAASGAKSTATSAQKTASDATGKATGNTTSQTPEKKKPAKLATKSADKSGAAKSGDKKSEGEQKWDAMSEAQRKETFDKLPAEKKQGKSYYEWISEGYQYQKENWMPWIEDQYLKWFTNDNKASYATKDTLSKSKVTGIEQVDTLQDGVNNLVGDQVGQGGVLQPVGDFASKEGVNRAERGGKDESGGYGIASGASSLGSSAWSGAKSAGGYVSSFVGGSKEGTAEKK